MSYERDVPTARGLVKDSAELARLCSLDIGRQVHPEDVRRFLLIGPAILWQRGYTEAEISDIRATLIKEMG